ncbi:MAG: hypothetical protein LBH97_06135 [Treponema sp.]|jgi:F0F1-type ATP synthase membrane subunit b/b'|nr:hypothetical protein [Treponema sp.]
MNDDEILGHLLEIEAEAAELVNDAQAESDKRLAEAEKQNRADYGERCRRETEKLEAELQKIKEQAQNQYRQELEAYHEKLSSLNANTSRFSALLGELVMRDS